MKSGVYILANGTTIVLDHRPDAVDFAFGVAYRVGVRDESPIEHGSSHAIEHLTGRGSLKYPTTVTLTRPLDRLAAETNADTDWEMTEYFTRVPADSWLTAVDLTVDAVQHPLFRPEDLKLEAGAIVEELTGNMDDAAECVGFTLQRLLYGDSTLGRNIVGSRRTIRGFSPDGLRDFQARHYVPASTVVAAVGRLPPELLPALHERFAGLPARAAVHPFDALGAPSPQRHAAVLRRDLKQVQFGLGFPTPYGHGHPRRFAQEVLETALAGYASSILYQEVRDRRGLVYEISADASAYRGVGDFAIYGGVTGRRRLQSALRAIVRELRAIKNRGLLLEDLADSISCQVNDMLVNQQDSLEEVQRLLTVHIHGSSVIDQESREATYRAVTNDDIIAVAREIWRASAAHLVTVGPVADLAPYLPIIARLGD